MAAFKVGQRVRIIGGPFVGSEATVLGIWRNEAGEECPFVSYPWSVRLDTGHEGPYMACELAPLTDPGAEYGKRGEGRLCLILSTASEEDAKRMSDQFYESTLWAYEVLKHCAQGLNHKLIPGRIW